MQDKLTALLHEASTAIASASLQSLEELRVQFLGKKGELTQLLKQVSTLPKADRPVMGQAVNKAKRALTEEIAQRQTLLEAIALSESLERDKLDVTLPGRFHTKGSFHPVTQIRTEISDIFTSLGFDVVSGPEIEDEFHNFEALNLPADHPAREMQDTFYIDAMHLLRSQTSPTQIRTMQSRKPPLRIISPGRVYRRDSDHTHTPMFHQVEGLVVDKDITFAHLKGLLREFVSVFFGPNVAMRFRPSYFPFTEPSAEVDIACQLCDGSGCRVCGQSGWLEVLGCGMVHPNVLRNVDLDPDEWNGFAFGMGMDRLAMLKFGIDDLRLFFEGDVRFLKQF